MGLQTELTHFTDVLDLLKVNIPDKKKEIKRKSRYCNVSILFWFQFVKTEKVCDYTLTYKYVYANTNKNNISTIFTLSITSIAVRYIGTLTALQFFVFQALIILEWCFI